MREAGLRRRTTTAVALSLAVALPCGSVLGAEPPVSVEPITPLPQSVDEDAAKVRLGERLFADKRLSHEQNRSCASCHPIDHGGVDGLRRPPSADGTLLRNTPTVFNVGFNTFLNWDGGAERLAPHDDRVLLKPALMNTTKDELLQRLSADPEYRRAFASLTPGGVTWENVLEAIASYERSLITPNSRFDRYLRGERAALGPMELKGYELFKSYGCIACHQGINVGGNVLQKFGVFADTAAGGRTDEPVDEGRFRVTRRERDKGVFRVPSLRNVAVTAPYFHDGRAATLEAAVTEMARVQLGRELKSEQIAQIAAFLGTLTGDYQGRPVGGGPRAPPR
jgi:cytochrome c peroxidase